VAWLDETLRAVDIQRSAIVSGSRGAWIGTNYAVAFPERVERLALVCPVGIVRGLSLSFLIRGLTTMGVRPTEERIWSFLDAMVMPTNRTSLRQEPWRPVMQQFVAGTVGFKAALGRPLMKPWPMRPDCDLLPLTAARIPVLAIMGRDDSLHNGPKAATRFRKQLPEARIELVDDANHMILSDQPEIVEKLLIEFLQ
jgi:pimeloyl-ACP methyl ester carboxylesterase